MYNVRFMDVGSQNKSWEAQTETLDYDWLYTQVKKYGMVMSSGLSFYIDPMYRGTIYAGFRAIGKFEVAEVCEDE